MLTRSDIIQVNRIHRQEDESNLFPIRGKFIVADRAIRQARPIIREYICDFDKTSYHDLLDELESKIVNNEKNWR